MTTKPRSFTLAYNGVTVDVNVEHGAVVVDLYRGDEVVGGTYRTWAEMGLKVEPATKKGRINEVRRRFDEATEHLSIRRPEEAYEKGYWRMAAARDRMIEKIKTGAA
jgi:hypothetical protein